jgi:hypothetical protein
MTGTFVGRFKHRDKMATRIKDAEFEEVRDDEFCPQNPYPASTSEICKMSPEAYREWKTTGKKPVMDDDPDELEPVADTSCKASEAFALASDRKNGYDNGRPSEPELSQMNPQERFVACSDARNRLNPNYKRDARLRRRE